MKEGSRKNTIKAWHGVETQWIFVEWMNELMNEWRQNKLVNSDDSEGKYQKNQRNWRIGLRQESTEQQGDDSAVEQRWLGVNS